MILSYKELSIQPGFSELSQEAKDFLKTIDNENGEDPQALFCDKCGAFCGDDYSFDFVEGLACCPIHREGKHYDDEGDYRWYEIGKDKWNAEALVWLKALGKIPYTFSEAALFSLAEKYGKKHGFTVHEEKGGETGRIGILQKLADGLFLDTIICCDEETGKILADFQITDDKDWYSSVCYTEHQFPELLPSSSAEDVFGKICREMVLISETVRNTADTIQKVAKNNA